MFTNWTCWYLQYFIGSQYNRCPCSSKPTTECKYSKKYNPITGWNKWKLKNHMKRNCSFHNDIKFKYFFLSSFFGLHMNYFSCWKVNEIWSRKSNPLCNVKLNPIFFPIKPFTTQSNLRIHLSNFLITRNTEWSKTASNLVFWVLLLCYYQQFHKLVWKICTTELFI